MSSIFFALGDFERVDRAIQQGEGGAGEEQQGGEGGGLLFSPFILAHHQLPQQSDHQSHHQHLLQHQSHDKPRCGDKVPRRTAGGSVLTRRGGTVDKAPRLSIIIDIWILLSDTICQLIQFYTNSEAEMLSRGGERRRTADQSLG